MYVAQVFLTRFTRFLTRFLTCVAGAPSTSAFLLLLGMEGLPRFVREPPEPDQVYQKTPLSPEWSLHGNGSDSARWPRPSLEG